MKNTSKSTTLSAFEAKKIKATAQQTVKGGTEADFIVIDDIAGF